MSSNLLTMVRPPACDRARTWASLRLDGELSELETALLDAHVSRCADCRGAVAGIEAATVAIRTASLERAPAVALAAPAAIGSLRRFVAASAAVLATTVALTGAG